MYVTGKMNWTFAVNRIPTGWVGTAEKLDFQSIACGGLSGIFANHLLGGLPSSPTGCAAFDSDTLNLSVDNIGIHLWRTKTFFIASQTAWPGKAASGGWGNYTGSGMLFPRCHHRNSQIFTQPGQILREIWMF